MFSDYPQRLRQTRKGRAFLASIRTLVVTTLVVASIVLIAPLTYDEQAHLKFNVATRHWSWMGDQIFGFDITSPRQNIFSLARDLDRTIIVVDHADSMSSRVMGLASWVGRGAIHTVANALAWFDVPLTSKQALSLKLCDPLDTIRENQPIIVQSDAYQYGIASWYGPGFHGRMAASGEIYNMYDRTAAHKTLPLQSLIRVVATRTGKSVVVRINDRGPYISGRTVDLSHRAKQLLGMEGLAAIYIEVIDPTALNSPCE